jgi:hypothetical protein
MNYGYICFLIQLFSLEMVLPNCLVPSVFCTLLALSFGRTIDLYETPHTSFLFPQVSLGASILLPIGYTAAVLFRIPCLDFWFLIWRKHPSVAF